MPTPLSSSKDEHIWRSAGVLASTFLRRGQRSMQLLIVAVGVFAVALLFAGVATLGFLFDAGERAEARFAGPYVEDGCLHQRWTASPYEFYQIERRILAEDCDVVWPPAPPGLDTFPRPGEVFVSPALNALRAVDEDIAQQFPTIDGTIDREGLTHAGELYVIVGAEADATFSNHFAEFGKEIGGYLESYLRFGLGTLAAIGAVIALPPFVLLISFSTRTSARIRSRQAKLFGLLGVAPRVVRLGMTVEVVTLTAVGAVIGSVGSFIGLPYATITFVGWTAAPGDLAVPLVALPLGAIAIVAIAGVAAWRATRRLPRGSDRLADGEGQPAGSRVQTVGLLCLVLGLVAGVVSYWWHTDNAWPVAAGGRILTAIGLGATAPLLVYFASGPLENANSSVGWLVSARLRRPAGSLVRSIAALAVGLFLFTASTAAVATFTEDLAAVDAAVSDEKYTTLRLARVTADNVAAIGEVPAAVVEVENPETTNNPGSTYMGSCEDVALFLELEQPCDERYFVNLYSDRPVDPNLDATVVVAQRRSRLLVLGTVIVTDERPELVGASELFVALPKGEAQNTINRILAADPAASIRTDSQAITGGASEKNEILDVFRFGALVAIVTTILAALVAQIAMAADRYPSNQMWRVLGGSSGEVLVSSILEPVLPVATSLGVSAVSSLVWVLGYQVAGQRPLDWATIVVPYIVVAAVMLLATTFLAISLNRGRNVSLRPDVDGLADLPDAYSFE